MLGSAFVDLLKAAVPGGDHFDPGIDRFEVRPHHPAAVADVCRWLHDSPETGFDSLQCITAVDWFEPDPKKAAKAGWDPHLELVYHLWSTRARVSLVLKTKLPRWKGELRRDLAICRLARARGL
jgi:NADH:ubiquinone oxidoreductase subunit C